MAALLIVILRLVIPLTIFRWPLAGGAAAVFFDLIDVVLFDALILIWMSGEFTFFGLDYHALDKWFDIYFLSFAAFVSLRWTSTLARNTSIALFAYRVFGVVLFEVSGIRALLFFFPNLFENFYFYYLVVKRWFPRLVPKNLRQLALVLFVLSVPKFGQEWLLHIAEAKPWVWLRDTFLLTK